MTSGTLENNLGEYVSGKPRGIILEVFQVKRPKINEVCFTTENLILRNCIKGELINFFSANIKTTYELTFC